MQSGEKKGESDHLLEILENLDRDFRDSRDSSSEKTPSVMTPCPVPNFWGQISKCVGGVFGADGAL